ncbi:hypothetical protein ENUP19_0370G0023 [Entamoeba nuttalli]|uniref:Polynucleotide adenylyltransferase n=2 Tax=Entamoeba nuttalli TaxID=412467 RepID=K2HSJ8_ENTNP|nr:polynucleotide adenylyltransferase [Entamoeba nuttalli P19]EKE39060.1 polynucleotide adenylyltransferase [Entamoeba nuttalli P19]|eukprot:XP_008858606.1 polynucleotide adenylyltransferase [Entamoeba nuttalli P19]
MGEEEQFNEFFQRLIEINSNESFQKYKKVIKTEKESIESNYLKNNMRRIPIEGIIKELNKIIKIEGEIVPYGSSYFDFFDGKSDIDITILTTDKPKLFKYNQNDNNDEIIKQYYNINKNNNISIIYQLFKILNNTSNDLNKNITNIQIIDKALVPIINCKIKGYEIDISINNYEGWYNSELIKTYYSIHPKIRSFIYFIKQFHKENKLINPKNGMFNSFTIILLVINFLIQNDYLPELQNENDIKKECTKQHIIHKYSSLCDKQNVIWYDCYYCFSKYRFIWDSISLKNLFIHFLHFYISFDYSQLISINPSFFKSNNSFLFNSNLSIISPFLPFLNLTRRFDSQLIQLQNCYLSFYQKQIHINSSSVFAASFNNTIHSVLKELKKYNPSIIISYYIKQSIGGIVFIQLSSPENYIQLKLDSLTHKLNSISFILPFDSKIITYNPHSTIAIKYIPK